METFAREDGFESVEDMARFWWAEHPPEEGDRVAFEGMLIRWQPLDAAPFLPAAAPTPSTSTTARGPRG